jgi:hypothetical protein
MFPRFNLRSKLSWHLSKSADKSFENIEGYHDVKNIVIRALESEDNYNLLLCGPPASSKTLFLMGILDMKNGVYFDGSNTTNKILDVLEQERLFA